MSSSSRRSRQRLARAACVAAICCMWSPASAQEPETKRRAAARPPAGEPVLTVFTPEPARFELALNEVDVSGKILNVPVTSGPDDLLRVSAALEAKNPGREVGLVLYEPGQPRSVATRAILTREIGLIVDPHVVVNEVLRDIGAPRSVAGVEHAYVV